MNSQQQQILSIVYLHSQKNNEVNIADLSLHSGMPINSLWPLLEDLREAEHIYDFDGNYTLTPSGFTYCRSIWP